MTCFYCCCCLLLLFVGVELVDPPALRPNALCLFFPALKTHHGIVNSVLSLKVQGKCIRSAIWARELENHNRVARLCLRSKKKINLIDYWLWRLNNLVHQRECFCVIYTAWAFNPTWQPWHWLFNGMNSVSMERGFPLWQPYRICYMDYFLCGNEISTILILLNDRKGCGRGRWGQRDACFHEVGSIWQPRGYICNHLIRGLSLIVSTPYPHPHSYTSGPH